MKRIEAKGVGDNDGFFELAVPVDEMTPEVHAYWEGRAESSVEIQALKDALREADCPDSCYNGGTYTDLGHGNFEMVRCEWCKNRTALIGDEKLTHYSSTY